MAKWLGVRGGLRSPAGKMRILLALPVGVSLRQQQAFKHARDHGVLDDFPAGMLEFNSVLIELASEGYLLRKETREKFKGGLPFVRYTLTTETLAKATTDLPEEVSLRAKKISERMAKEPVVPCAMCGRKQRQFTIWYGTRAQVCMPACSTTCRELLRARLLKQAAGPLVVEPAKAV